MKLVNLQTFLAMPNGTVYSKWEPCVCDGLNMKEANTGIHEDWVHTNLIDNFDDEERFALFNDESDIYTKGVSFPTDLDEGTSRDGCYEPSQMFLVWEDRDLFTLVRKLAKTLPGDQTLLEAFLNDSEKKLNQPLRPTR